jgi:hypothetical protein
LRRRSQKRLCPLSELGKTDFKVRNEGAKRSFMNRGSKVVFGAKGAVLHEPRARLVARMFTFSAKKIA